LAAGAGLGTDRASAQFPAGPQLGPQVGGQPRPTFSPYLNLNRGGTSPAINYYGIVRPQFQARSEFQSLEQQAANNRQAITDLGTPPSGLPTTGHSVAFLNTMGYFQNLNPTQGTAIAGGQGGFGGQGYSFGGQGFMQGGSGPRPGGTGGAVGGGASGGTRRR
jgi:hypothetical protein